MLVDIAIVIFAISALYRGKEIGFVRQFCSTIGFFGGLFVGTWLEPHTIHLAHTTTTRALVTVGTTLGSSLIGLLIGEYVGIALKHKVQISHVNKLDNTFGALLSIVSFLFSIWLTAAIINSLQIPPSVQMDLRNSRIVSALNRYLPSAPNVVASIGHLIDPNGFPQVFIGGEPSPARTAKLPDLGELQTAVQADKASVVKLEGQGCGGIVEGSGFIVGSDYVATNAHVVAGIKHPMVQDANGTHSATVVWFDPNLDFAVLRVSNLAGRPLIVSGSNISDGTPAAVLGYPGGGTFAASPAAIQDSFTANGRNIYGKGNTDRSIYEMHADVIPGNSGGPVVGKDGSVIGVVFAESTTYNHVGYALTNAPIISAINQAQSRSYSVNTGSCAE